MIFGNISSWGIHHTLVSPQDKTMAYEEFRYKLIIVKMLYSLLIDLLIFSVNHCFPIHFQFNYSQRKVFILSFSSIFIPQTLISRNYRGDNDMSIIDKFLPMVYDMEEEGNMSPILIHENATFVYIKHNNLYCILLINKKERILNIYGNVLMPVPSLWQVRIMGCGLIQDQPIYCLHLKYRSLLLLLWAV